MVHSSSGVPTFNELWISHKIVGRAWAAAAAHCTTLCTELVFIIARLDIANPDGRGTHTDGLLLLLFKQYCRDFRPLSSIQDLASLDHIARCKCVQLIKAHFVAKWKMLFGLDLMAFFISPIQSTYLQYTFQKDFFSLWPFPTTLMIKRFTYFSQSIPSTRMFSMILPQSVPCRRKSYTTYSNSAKYQMKLVLQWDWFFHLAY